MASMERHFQVGVPAPVAQARWQSFRHEAGGGIEACFEPALGEETRVRLTADSLGVERARLDQVAEAFLHFVAEP